MLNTKNHLLKQRIMYMIEQGGYAAKRGHYTPAKIALIVIAILAIAELPPPIETLYHYCAGIMGAQPTSTHCKQN